MNSNLPFVIILITIIAVENNITTQNDDQKNEKTQTDSDNSDDPDDYLEENEDDETSVPTADLNCILFGNPGCHATCALIGAAYSEGSIGACNEKFICECKIFQYPSLVKLWSKKFVNNETSNKILPQINSNSEKSSKTLHILRKFPQTTIKCKEDLIQAFPEISDLSQLTPITNSPVDHFTRDENIDVNAIKQFVNDQLASSPISEDIHNDLFKVHYQDRLKTFIIAYKLIPESLLKEISNTKNQELIQLFEKLSNQSVKINDENDDNPANLIAACVTNAFLAYVKNPSKFFSTDISSKSFVTPRKELILKQLQTCDKIQKEWKYSDSHIIYKKNLRGIINLTWKLGSINVKIIIIPNGAEKQYWIFDKVHIKLIAENDGSVLQIWNFGENQLEYHKSADGHTTYSWKNEQWNILQPYKTYMESWCKENADLFSIKKCIIY